MRYQRINVGDSLNIHLVAGGLKPATILCESISALLTPVESTKKFETRIKIIENKLLEFQLEYECKIGPLEPQIQKTKKRSFPIPTYTIRTEHQLLANFNIAKTQENLQALINAKTDKEYGQALGYPTPAIEAYTTYRNGVRICGNTLVAEQIKAKKLDIEIPTWLAYISHVPEKFDLVNDDISPTSKEQGLKYQEFIREQYPELAEKVEKQFKQIKNTQVDYKLKDDGTYTITYKFPNSKLLVR